MRPHLLFPAADFDPTAERPAYADDLFVDLDLAPLVHALAAGDDLVAQSVTAALAQGTRSAAEVFFRQAVLKDFRAEPDLLDALSGIAAEALAAERQLRLFFLRSPESIVRRSVELLGAYQELLRRLAAQLGEHRHSFSSPGLQRLAETAAEQLTEEFFAALTAHLKVLRFPDGITARARLGARLEGRDYHLIRAPRRRLRFLERVTNSRRDQALSFRVDPRDESGNRALTAIRNQAVDGVARTLDGAVGDLLGFFTQLARELAFYRGALRFGQLMAGCGLPASLPDVRAGEEGALSAQGLYDPSLALRSGGQLMTNDLAADGKRLVIVTGPNQGGKSTFLRALGAAMTMAAAGLPVPARAMAIKHVTAVLTHFKRGEDALLAQGKFDEELSRLRGLIDAMPQEAAMLMNESFAATNESEGSAVAREVVRALIDAGERVFFVTHLYTFADAWRTEGREDILFLRAERLADGQRTFRIEPGLPRPTSHGGDLYRRIFGGGR